MRKPQWWEETYGTWVTQGYGMTETSPQICFSSIKTTLAEQSPEALYALRQKQGLPIPLMQIKVCDEQVQELPWDGEAVGDFYVRAPFAASAYYDDERTADSFADGWLRTGGRRQHRRRRVRHPAGPVQGSHQVGR